MLRKRKKETRGSDFISSRSKGLTKLEFFAAMALKGLTTSSMYEKSADLSAKWAVESAKALIKELNKESNGKSKFKSSKQKG